MSKTRRWFRFSLGALLLLVALFGCWFAWEVNWIHRRQAALARIKPHTLAIITLASEATKTPGDKLFLPYDHVHDIPIWRRLMGDEAVGWIYFYGDAPDEDVKLAKQLFPEALVEQSQMLVPQ